MAIVSLNLESISELGAEDFVSIDGAAGNLELGISHGGRDDRRRFAKIVNGPHWGWPRDTEPQFVDLNCRLTGDNISMAIPPWVHGQCVLVGHGKSVTDWDLSSDQTDHFSQVGPRKRFTIAIAISFRDLL
jgi:hypothetical protein